MSSLEEVFETEVYTLNGERSLWERWDGDVERISGKK